MHNRNEKILKLYRRMGFLTCSSVFLLFLFGGLVRATGSGMGCPDWPKCFGLWAPPICECKLPANYQTLFLEKRLQKVERFAKVLNGFGMEESAQRLLSDPSIQVPESFDPVRAWIEYINRLFGVLSGLFALFYLVLMVWNRKIIADGKLWGGIGFFLLLLNAWLGSLVVATNLLPGVVTVHFVLSFMCLFAYMVSLHKAKSFSFPGDDLLDKKHWFFLWVMVFLIVMIGAWSREQVDLLRLKGELYANGDTEGFLGYGMLNVFAMDWIFAIHRYLPFLILAYAIWWMRKQSDENLLRVRELKGRFPLKILVSLCALQIGIGVVHIWFVIPAWAQVCHVVVASAIITYIFAVYLAVRSKSQLS